MKINSDSQKEKLLKTPLKKFRLIYRVIYTNEVNVLEVFFDLIKSI